MSPERAVAPADKDVFFPGLLCYFIHYRRNLMMGFRRLLHRKAPGIGQYVKQVVLFLKALTNTVLLPVGIYGNIMHRLNSCRIVVQNHDFFMICSYFFL